MRPHLDPPETGGLRVPEVPFPEMGRAQRGQVMALKSKVWVQRRRGRVEFLVDYLDPVTGRRHRLTAPSQEAAELLLASKITEIRQARPVPTMDPEITMRDYVGLTHAEAKAAGTEQTGGLARLAVDVESRTVQSYAENWTRHIKPALGGLKVRATHRGHIKALLAAKRQPGLGKNSVRL